MKRLRDGVRAAGVALVGLTLAGTAAEVADKPALRVGADERVRQEYFDHIPIIADPPGYTRGGENDYFRFRTRVWGELDVLPSVRVRARVVNESRAWLYPDVTERPQRSTSEWPDEWVFDNLYLDVRDLLDKQLDLRIGRQEMIYGTGKVILEGTAGDGSRTIYFNAAKASWKGIPDSTLDAFAIYNESEDELAINPADRDLNVFLKAVDGVTESGGGLYFKNQSFKSLPYELYAIYKQESAWDQKARTNAAGAYLPGPYAWQTLDAGSGMIENPQLDLGTFGFRLMPVVADGVNGNLEAALQVGQRDEEDVLGYMVDAFMTHQVPGAYKPAVDYGVYALSGDDKSSDKDEGWNPLWARYPQYSELYVYSWDAEDPAGRWSNVLMPHVGLTLSPSKCVKTTATVCYLMAMEDDGPGDGKERGWLGTAKAEFTLGQKLWLPKDLLTGHVWVEVLEPGDYYDVDDTAVFARWQLNYAF